MGILDNIERRNSGLSDDWYFPGGSFWGGIPETHSGAKVSEQAAMRLAIVWCCIKILSEDSASLPLFLYKKRKSGGKDKVTDDERYGLLHDKPNPEMSAMSFRETMMSHLVGWGNCYAEKEFYGGWIKGRVKHLWPITPNRVTVKRDSNAKIIYEVNLDKSMVNGQTKTKVTLDKSQCMHTPGLSFNGLVGYSPIAVEREAIGLGLSLEQFGATYFKNGITPSMIVTHPMPLKDPTKLRTALQDIYGGLGNAHRVMLLDEGMTHESLSIPLNEAQFIESKNYSNIEIGTRIYRIPAHMYGELERSTNNNIEHQGIEYVQFTLRSWIVRLEQSYNLNLLTDQERKEGYFFEHVLDGLLRGDQKSRSIYYRTMFNIGGITINEMNELENRNPIGPEGDRRFVPMNMVPLDKVDEYLENKNKGNSPSDSNNDDDLEKELKSIEHGGNGNGKH